MCLWADSSHFLGNDHLSIFKWLSIPKTPFSCQFCWVRVFDISLTGPQLLSTSKSVPSLLLQRFNLDLYQLIIRLATCGAKALKESLDSLPQAWLASGLIDENFYPQDVHGIVAAHRNTEHCAVENARLRERLSQDLKRHLESAAPRRGPAKPSVSSQSSSSRNIPTILPINSDERAVCKPSSDFIASQSSSRPQIPVVIGAASKADAQQLPLIRGQELRGYGEFWLAHLGIVGLIKGIDMSQLNLLRSQIRASRQARAIARHITPARRQIIHEWNTRHIAHQSGPGTSPVKERAPQNHMKRLRRASAIQFHGLITCLECVSAPPVLHRRRHSDCYRRLLSARAPS